MTTPALKSTITHEALARVAKAPTMFAAWVLRAVANELQDARKDLAWALNELRMRTDVPPVLDRVNEISERYKYADFEWPPADADSADSPGPSPGSIPDTPRPPGSDR